jgi:hypothetical protein
LVAADGRAKLFAPLRCQKIGDSPLACGQRATPGLLRPESALVYNPEVEGDHLHRFGRRSVAICSIIDNQGRRVAEVDIHAVEDGWYYGRLVKDAIPDELRRDLEWYDQVVSNQMLSYLDDVRAAVERHELSVCFADETCHKAYALHIDRSGDTTFRIAPVPPPGSKGPDNSTGLEPPSCPNGSNSCS